MNTAMNAESVENDEGPQSGTALGSKVSIIQPINLKLLMLLNYLRLPLSSYLVTYRMYSLIIHGGDIIILFNFD